ncbi:hypothetical protein CORC01_03551 [Colletotrichum orchidophilum]|uniref:DUF676 domain-containing protein n=1 Tax=Colletotrichum orchidophilum TaxID=1209926 RepID=A0A1G4BIV2_9PEZI|nr:uncharacterized protein CORC01_03551 [Colletotrichum orchidophilum]OHF01236.1 hypothetical protein CORC01_03551 [Colletotrichum orchidophilum]
MELIDTFDAEDDSPDKDILVVHGLSRRGGNPWKATATRPAWLREDLFNSSNASILGFNYDNIFNSEKLMCNQTGLKLVVCQLLDDIVAWKESEGDRPRAILAHDIGGILVKMALVIASSNLGKYSQLISSLYALVFIGCPHKTSSSESLVNGFATLICNARSIPDFGLLQAAKDCAKMTIDVNYLFLNSNMPFRMQIISVFSETPDPIDRIFDEFTATLDLSCENRIGLPHPHDTLLGHELGDRENQLLKGTLEFPKPGIFSCQGLQLLLSTVSPPPTFQAGLEYDTSDKLRSEEELEEWIENPASINPGYIWASAELSPSSTIGSFVRLVSEANKFTTGTEIRTFAFQFRKLKLHPEIDSGFRLSIVQQVLESFLAQALAYISPQVEPNTALASLLSLFERTSSSAKPLGEDLLKVLFVALNCYLWRKDIRAIWSVWNLEYCGGDTEVTTLLGSIKALFRFTMFKPAIVFSWSGHSTSNFGRIMQDANIHRFQLKSLYQRSQDNSNRFSIEFFAPPGSYMGLGTLPESIDTILRDTKDNHLRGTFLQWVIRTAQTSVSRAQWLQRIHEVIDDDGKLEPQRLQIAISGFLAREDNVVANSALHWVQFCCRSLSPTELVTALALEQSIVGSEGSDFSADQNHRGKDMEDAPSIGFHFIHDHLSSLIEVIDNEVRLTYDNMEEPNDTDPWHSSNSKSNLLILRCLLRHLCVEAERIGPNVSHSGLIPPSLFHHDFTAYAANFWPHHYRLARCHPSTKLEAESLVAKFLKENHAASLLMLRYAQNTVLEVSDRTNTEHTTATTAVGLLALCGFNDIEEIGILAICPGWESRPKTAFPALLEAVRGVHTRLLEKLSVSVLGDEEARKVFSAVEPGKLTHDCIYDLLRQAQSRKIFQIPLELISCAAFAGIGGIAESIKDGPIDSSISFTWLLRAISIPSLETADAFTTWRASP